MHHTIKYGKDVPDRQAALDFAQWFGFRKTLLLARAAAYPYDKFAFFAGMGGVQGKPVAVFYERIRAIRNLPVEKEQDNG